MKITIETVNVEQTLFIEKALRYHVGNEAISIMPSYRYKELFNELSNIHFESSSLPDEGLNHVYDLKNVNFDGEQFNAIYF